MLSSFRAHLSNAFWERGMEKHSNFLWMNFPNVWCEQFFTRKSIICALIFFECAKRHFWIEVGKNGSWWLWFSWTLHKCALKCTIGKHTTQRTNTLINKSACIWEKDGEIAVKKSIPAPVFSHYFFTCFLCIQKGSINLPTITSYLLTKLYLLNLLKPTNISS